MHELGIVAHSFPMALEGKQHTLLDADGTEDTPAVQQTSLAGRERLGVGVEDVVVMKKKAMQTSV